MHLLYLKFKSSELFLPSHGLAKLDTWMLYMLKLFIIVVGHLKLLKMET